MADGGGAAGAGEAGPAVTNEEVREYRSGPVYKLTVGLISTYKHINEVREKKEEKKDWSLAPLNVRLFVAGRGAPST